MNKILKTNIMPWTNVHNLCFDRIVCEHQTIDGKEVILLEFHPERLNPESMSRWAKHLRNHYCFDNEIDELRDGTGLSRAEYLEVLKFPSRDGFGPAIRAGDFGEILISDYMEFFHDYWIPRTRYGNKTIRDESTKGTDVIGIKIINDNVTINDILILIEAKAQFTGRTKPRLQDSVNSSAKDHLRKAESLNAIKQRLLDKGRPLEAAKVQRFQNISDKPYTQQYAAAALFSNDVFKQTCITECTTVNHTNNQNLFLIVLKGETMMNTVHQLYTLAANEA